jgi:hypothetical protein
LKTSQRTYGIVHIVQVAVCLRTAWVNIAAGRRKGEKEKEKERKREREREREKGQIEIWEECERRGNEKNLPCWNGKKDITNGFVALFGLKFFVAKQRALTTAYVQTKRGHGNGSTRRRIQNPTAKQQSNMSETKNERD